MSGPAEKQINWDLFELYCKSGTCQVKISKALGVTRDTLRRRATKKYGKEYSAIYADLHNTGDLLLEAAQFQKALKSSSPGNAQMLMYLGKVRLGQREQAPVSNISPEQDIIDQQHKIMMLENKVDELERVIAFHTKAKD